MLYKDPKDVKYKVHIIDGDNDTLVFDFWADCGKHGTDESVEDSLLQAIIANVPQLNAVGDLEHEIINLLE